MQQDRYLEIIRTGYSGGGPEMSVKASTAAERRAIPQSEAGQAIWCLAGVGVGIVWTFVGWGLAGLQGQAQAFLHEWRNLQGFFLVVLGTWILLIVRSGTLRARISDLRTDGTALLGPLADRPIRFGIVCSIGVLGTASLIGLGFPAHGFLLAYMWITAAWVCFTAGAATLHTIEVLALVHDLPRVDIKAYRYAPARTPELRGLVSYFSSFSLLVTIGYVFALAGTLDAHWTGSREYIEGVRLFWPVLYVPVCTIAMIYPHVVAHRLIQKEKEKILMSCQQDIDQLLARFQELKTDDINRTNTLAQLFDRIVGTPNYVIDFGIAVRTLLPLVVNVASFFAKAAFTHGQASGA